jgi:threonine synthase
MDVGNPSNWVRIADMFKEDITGLNKLITGYSFNDDETLAAINAIYDHYKYIACPHTAIAWQALKDYQQDVHVDDTAGIFLSTAHPCKFPDVFPTHIADKVDVPAQVQALQVRAKQSVALGKDFDGFKDYLLTNA